MMADSASEKKILLVLSVLDGRYFTPREPGTKIVVEAKLGSDLAECLLTDAVPLTSSPKFDSELAFEFSEKVLRQHRVNRTPLKVTCIAVNSKNSPRDVIGNIVMTLREAAYEIKEAKWRLLLNCKFSKHRPELLMRLYVETEKQKREPEEVYHLPSSMKPKLHLKEKENRPPPPQETTVKQVEYVPPTNDSLKIKQSDVTPILNAQEGYYQIGPENILNEKFIFSMTLAFAENLECLSKDYHNAEYFFFYSMFANDVSTEKFKDLTHPDFPIERASVRIKATMDCLTRFFKQQDSFQVILCCGDRSVAFTNLSLKQFTDNKYFTHPENLEGVFELIPENETERRNFNPKPAIGISMSLIQDSHESIMLSKDEALSAIFKNSSSKSELSKIDDKKHKEEISVEEYSVDFEKSSENDTDTLRSENSEVKSIVFPPKNLPNKETQHQQHRFTFTVDLRSFLLEAGVKPLNCFFRYAYPFFGTSTPIVTHPSVEVTSDKVSILPHGYCGFNFITTPAQLEGTFREIPLIVELIETTVTHGKTLECLVGVGKLSLGTLYNSPKANYTTPAGQLGSRRTSALNLPMISLNADELGKAFVVISLDEFGRVNLEENPPLHESKASNGNIEDDVKVSDILPEKSSDAANGAKAKAVTANDVLKVSLELELWKEQQQMLFRQKLKEKEAEHIQALTSEWKKRDTDREIFLRNSVRENQQLEDKLKRALSDVELRERQLKAKESELERNVNDFFNRISKTESDAKDSVRRIKTECDYRLDLEKQKSSNLERDYKKLKEKTTELEKWLFEKEQLFQSVQNKLNGLPDYKLQTDIAVLQSEKDELKRKLESAIVSKDRYKSQWGKALRQISALQQQLNSAERAELTNRVKELEKEKLKDTAIREEVKISREKQKLDEIKDEMTKLKGKYASNEDSSSKIPATFNYIPQYMPIQRDITVAPDLQNSVTTISEVSSKGTKDPVTYLEGLMSEKRLLLESGVYKANDMIIKVLDKHINEAISKAKS